jgi:hypothetical protein
LWGTANIGDANQGKLSMLNENSRIGLRCQDIQTGLHDVDVDIFAPGEFQTLPLTGMAARLALRIRGRELVDKKQLSVIAATVGIKATELNTVVANLEEMDWVRAQKKNGAIEKITETIPYFSDLYETLGDFAVDKGLTEYERASISFLEHSASGPIAVSALREDGLEQRVIDDVIKIGEEGAYLSTIETKKGRMIYSPCYWQEGEQRLNDLISKFSDETIRNAIARIRVAQGTPLDTLQTTTEDEVLKQAISLGLLQTPSVTSVSGEKRFIFTPFAGNEQITLIEKHIYEKAMLILSCVRYGENFAQITRITRPHKILSALLDARRGHRIGPHSEIGLQYSSLVTGNIGKIIPDGNKYFFELIPTPENLKALQLAYDLLLIGEPIQDRGAITNEQEQFFSIDGTYKENLRSAADLKRKRQISVTRRAANQIAIEFAEIMSRGTI